MLPTPQLLADQNAAVERIAPSDWAQLRGQNVLLTGGTGFFGQWLLETWARANALHRLDAKLWIVSRSPGRFLTERPELSALPGLHWIEGDIATLQAPRGVAFSHAIHAAMDMGTIDPAAVLATSHAGTRAVARFCADAGVRRLLLVSSGAVYGRQPSELPRVPETFEGTGDLDSRLSGYAVGKRVSEWLARNHPALAKTEVTIARPFAFTGPNLPLDGNYAVSQFLRALLAGQPIRIGGDGTTERSYMYASDLSTWLWRILFAGAARAAYNVGSDRAITIAELAKRLRQFAIDDGLSPAPIEIAGKPVAGAAPERYVPSIEKARTELGLELAVDPDTALRKTWEHFARNHRSAR